MSNFPTLQSVLINIVVALSLITSSCNRKENLDPYGWEPIGEPFDSLVVALEEAWYEGADLERRRHLVEQLRSVSDSLRDNAQADVRAEFWEGRLAYISGDESGAEIHYNNVARLNDSTRYPYVNHRLEWLLEDDYPEYTLESYERIKSMAQYFEDSGDRLMAGAKWTDLAMFLYDMGMARLASQLLDRADSIYSLGGFTRLINGNIINRSKIYKQMGLKEAGERLLRRALADSIYANDHYGLGILYDCLVFHHGDSTALFKAFDLVRDDTSQTAMQSFYNGAISAYYLNRGQIDSALVYSDRSMINIEDIEMPVQLNDVLAWRSDALLAAGRDKEAYPIIHRRLEIAEEIAETTKLDEVMTHDFQERLAAAERADDRRVFKTRLLALGIVVILIVAAFTIILWQRRRNQRVRLQAMEQKLDLEKSQRRILAMKLALDEKEKLLTTIREQLAQNSEDNRNSRLEALIKTHTAGLSDERSSFMQTFTEINPEFERRLRTVNPSLTSADLRLASMISVGLTNKQIAAALGVRPESVKQARWRLRSKLGLGRDDSLEAFLATLP